MKNIHVIPTDKPSRLYLGNNGNFVFGMIQTSIQSRNDDFTNQNIYITSDEEIKEGDYVLDDEQDVFQVLKINHTQGVLRSYGFTYAIDICKKIILTTDQYLITNGVQAIDDEFLKWFVKNPNCEEVDIKIKSTLDKVDGHYHDLWEIIIPKEESINYRQTGASEFVVKTIIKNTIILKEKPKQETLEEAAERFTTFCTWGCEKSFIEGAKWQMERSYSEEEILTIAKDAYTMGRKGLLIGVFNKWFEQFKNK